MKSYLFTVTLRGEGNTPEDAWMDAVTAFAIDPGGMPEFTEDEDAEEE